MVQNTTGKFTMNELYAYLPVSSCTGCEHGMHALGASHLPSGRTVQANAANSVRQMPTVLAERSCPTRCLEPARVHMPSQLRPKYAGTYWEVNSSLVLAGWQSSRCVGGNFCVDGVSTQCPPQFYTVPILWRFLHPVGSAGAPGGTNSSNRIRPC